MNTYKKKLFVDMDSTITDSIKSYCTVYNSIYNYKEGFKNAVAERVNQWDLKDECPLVENPEHIFSSRLFFTELEFMPNAYEVLERLSTQYELIICSIGTYDNISLKSIWIQRNLPFIKNSILIVNDGCKMDKSVIRMSDSIFLDDHANNLFTSNAEFKILFGKEYPWNTEWLKQGGRRIKTWLELEPLLLKF